MKQMIGLVATFFLTVGCGNNFSTKLEKELNDPTLGNETERAENIEDNENRNGSGGGSVPDNGGSETASRCQSDTFCVHAKMPLWSQADGAKLGVFNPTTKKVEIEYLNVNGSETPLLKYVQENGYPDIQKDPGWCGAVSFAMVMKTWEQDLQDRGETIASSELNFVTSSDASAVIFEVMGILKMKPSIGVSNPKAHEENFKIFQSTQGKGTVISKNAIITVEEFRTKYNKPLVTIATGHKDAGGHFLALNGTDGDYYIINDPWGSTYSVTAEKGKAVTGSPVGDYDEYYLTYVGSGLKSLDPKLSGFIPTYGTTTGILTSIIYGNY